MNKSNPIISVIVPFYNNEKQLQSTIESIRDQSFLDIEILLLNDGSSDSSWQIANLAAISDRRIKVYNGIRNQGPSARRNQCLNLATGRFIVFVDGDDRLTVDALNTLLKLQKKSNSDVIRGSCEIVQPTETNINRFDHFHHPEAEKLIYRNTPSLAMHYTSWNTLFLRSLALENSIQYPTQMRLGEDRVFVQKLYDAANSITLTKEKTYYWMKNRESGQHLSHGKDMSQRLLSIRYFIDTIRFLNNATEKHKQLVHTAMYHECNMALNYIDTHSLHESTKKAFQSIKSELQYYDLDLHNKTIKGFAAGN